MTRRMADSITARNCPPGFDLYLGYVDGNPDWRSYDDMVRLFPQAIHVPCTINPHGNIGVVLDVETGDATPQQAPAWVSRRRMAGCHPTVYCNASTWPAVRAAFHNTHVGEPEYLIASYGTDPTIPAGAVGHQWIDHGPYDESSVADYWPGVDSPPPAPPAPPTPPPGKAWEFQEAQVRQTLILIGPLDPQGRGYADWNPGLPTAPVVVGAVKQGPDPSAGSLDSQHDDPYWEKQGNYSVAASPRGLAVRVVVIGGQPGQTVGVYVSAA